MTAALPRVLGGKRLLGWNVHHRTSVYVLRFDPGAGAGESGRLLAQSMLDAILGVESQAAADMGRADRPGFSKVEETPDGFFELVWDSHATWISRAAAKAAFAGLLETLPAARRDARSRRGFDEAIARLKRVCLRRQWSRGAALLAESARRQGLPHQVLAGSYVRIGEGGMQRVVSDTATGLDHRVPGSADLALRRLYPGGAPATVPVVMVFGERGSLARSIARALDRTLRSSRGGIGLVLRDVMTVDGSAVERTSLGRRAGPDALLHHRRVKLLIAGDAPRRILARGLRLNGLVVTAVLDPRPDGNQASYRAALAVCLQASRAAVVSDANPYASLVIGALGEDRVTVVPADVNRSPRAFRRAVIKAMAQRLDGRTPAASADAESAPMMQAMAVAGSAAVTKALTNAGSATAREF